MSQSGFEMFSNVAGMVIVIADVIFFYALWNIFCKNKRGFWHNGGSQTP